MAHTYDHKEFIPIADAWEEAISALCPVPALSVETSTSKRVRRKTKSRRKRSAGNKDPREPNSFEKYDGVIRRIEKLMRDAIADGILHLFSYGPSGRLERALERERFRPTSFGIPGFENVPHCLTSPGVDTGDQPVYLKRSNFHQWLSAQRGNSLDRFTQVHQASQQPLK
jgi:hypothetical protein